MKHLILLCAILLIITPINIVSAQEEYRATCDFNGCTLHPIGQSCAAARNAFISPGFEGSDGKGSLIAAICFFVWCAPELVYDAVRYQDQKLAYLDETLGYTDKRGTHAFYTNDDCAIEVILHPSWERIPDAVKIESSQCYPAPGQERSTPGQGDFAPGKEGSTPGQEGTTPSQGDSAPGQEESTPGQEGTTPGQEGSAPGQCSDTVCEGECVDTQTDLNNCGECGNACTGGKECNSGECVCPEGQTDCYGICQECCDDGDCDDGDSCTSDSCNNGVCTSVAKNLPNGELCSENCECASGECDEDNSKCVPSGGDGLSLGSYCTQDSQCASGWCKSWACSCECESDADCPSSVPHCYTGGCAHSCVQDVQCDSGSCIDGLCQE